LTPLFHLRTLDIPGWAKRRVAPEKHSFSEVRRLHLQGRTQIQLPDVKDLKGWAKSRDWPTPWFGFKKAFIAKLFECDETFTLALRRESARRAAVDPGESSASGALSGALLSGSPLFADLKPAFERSLALPGALPEQEILHADVLVEVGPVDAFPVADQAPIMPLFRRAMVKPQIPTRGDRDGPAIGEIDCQRLFGGLDMDGSWHLHITR
jgi:hypothetical protein